MTICVKGTGMRCRHFAVAVIAVIFMCAQVGRTQDTKPATTEPQWLTSLDQAKAESQKSGKPILADFTGSDWCGWCIKLHKEVFDTQEFKEWAAKSVVLLEVDFPRKKAQDDATKQAYQALAKKYVIKGYPTIIFMSADGTKMGESGYKAGGPKAWTENAQKILDAKKPDGK